MYTETLAYFQIYWYWTSNISHFQSFDFCYFLYIQWYCYMSVPNFVRYIVCYIPIQKL